LDTRLRKIATLLSDYSLGRFDKKVKLSGKQDPYDGIIFALNMLGEELNATTISKNYFTNIFHAVSDVIIILDTSLRITNTNKIFEDTLGYNTDDLLQSGLEKITDPVQMGTLLKKIRQLNIRQKSLMTEIEFNSVTNVKIPFLVTVSTMYETPKKKKGYLLIAKDYSYQKQVESMVMRMIIETQEKERMRFANDIHDSLGQQISAVKFYISSCIVSSTSDEQRRNLEKSNEMLLSMIEDMRNICFAIMPKTLEVFGLVKTVKELTNKIRIHNEIDFEIQHSRHFPAIEKTKEIILYRVIQEFISNTLKHARASKIVISFSHPDNMIRIVLFDNGRGFNPAKTRKSGSGLENIKSRINACQGVVHIESRKGEGTRFEINLPIKQLSE
jgi:PAS domain S-box-containing protein